LGVEGSGTQGATNVDRPLWRLVREVASDGVVERETPLALGGLRVPPEKFFITGAPRDTATPEIVATHLLADPRLEREAASRIASVVRDMYAALASEPRTRVTVTCHLRAAATLRPGVPERLDGLLGAMQDRLMELEAEGVL
jgi:hypothetical protein